MVADGLCPQRMTLIWSSKYCSPWLHLCCLPCGSQVVCCPHSQWQHALCTAAGWAWLCVTWDFLTDDAVHILLWAVDQSCNTGGRNNYTTTIWSTLPCTLLCFPLRKRRALHCRILRWWLLILCCQCMRWLLPSKWTGAISAVLGVYGMGTQV